LDNWAFGFAWEAAKGFYIGGNLNYISGSYKSVRVHNEEDINDFYDFSTQTDPNDSLTADFNNFYLRDELNWNVSGWEIKGGFLFQVNRRLKLSATIKFPTIYIVDERFYIDAESQFGTGANYYLDPSYFNQLKYDILTPFEFTGGLSYKIQNFLISGQLNYIDYKNARFDYGLDPRDMSELNSEISQVLRGAFNYNIGGEVLIPRMQLKVRAGFFYQTSPYRNDPSDYDKKFITTGLGIGFTRTMEVNFAYVYGWSKNFGDLYSSNEARYFTDDKLHKFFLTLNFRY
jgi:long-subunit fatty acid transport protein